MVDSALSFFLKYIFDYDEFRPGQTDERVVLVIAQENVVFRQEFVQLFLKTLQHLTQQNVCLRFRDAVGVVVLAAGAAVVMTVVVMIISLVSRRLIKDEGYEL